MKAYAFLLFVCLSMKAMGQPPYPTAPAVSNLQRLEYFIDKDPGINNGKQILLPSTNNVTSFSFQADISDVPMGLHRFYIRAIDADGRLSQTENVYFDNFIVAPYPSASAPAKAIVALEYFINTDPGLGNGKAVIVPAGTNLPGSSFVADVTGLPPGVHRIYVRSKDADGKWSFTAFGQFDNTSLLPYPSAPPLPDLGDVEFYIDNDPGFGKGTRISFPAGTNLSNFSVDIPLNAIAQGAHTFYIRSRQNPWSMSAFVPFLYSSTLPVTWLYVKGEIKGNSSYIDWATATEEDADKFVVEHSTDGRQFTAIGEVDAAGNSSAQKRYQFIHPNPSKGMNYYRLKQLDKNGTYVYSKALHLLFQPDRRETMIAPNPATDKLYVISGEEQTISRIEVYDMSGKLILNNSVTSGQQVYSTDISSLQKGVYIIKLYGEKQIITQRFLKQ